MERMFRFLSFNAVEGRVPFADRRTPPVPGVLLGHTQHCFARPELRAWVRQSRMKP